MSENIVNFNEVLLAMTESLVEKQPVAFTEALIYQDQVLKFKIGGKPPREIFYRNTLTFLTKLPPPVQQKNCSCKYLCSGSLAVIKCHSCSIYDPKGMAFFCKECFDCYHPWYRVPHLFTDIENDEHIQHTLKVSHRVAEIGRYEREGGDMLSHLRSEYERLAFVADDAAIDDKMRVFGRSVLQLEDEVSALRATLRNDLYGTTVAARETMESPSQRRSLRGKHNISNHTNFVSNASSSLMELSKNARTESNLSHFSLCTLDSEESLVASEDSPLVHPFAEDQDHSPTSRGKEEAISRTTITACVRIQSVAKGYLARTVVSLVLARRVVRVWCPDEARDFFHDRVTGLSAWTPPKLLLSRHLDLLEYTSEEPARLIWACKNTTVRRRIDKVRAYEAPGVLISFARCILARLRLLRQANAVFRRVWDENASTYYFANVLTGETTWHKSKLYLSSLPPILQISAKNNKLVDVNQSSNSSTDRLNPKINRIRVLK